MLLAHDFTGELVLFRGHLLFLNELALPPLTDVLGSIGASKGALAVFFIILPIAGVLLSAGKGIGTLAVG